MLYKLKEVKNADKRDWWLLLYTVWEERYHRYLFERNVGGSFLHPKLRSARLVMRKAIPNLFTYIDYPAAPNTTNLVEGWVNAAVAEAIRLHRGLKDFEKKTLVSIVLSHLKRKQK